MRWPGVRITLAAPIPFDRGFEEEAGLLLMIDAPDADAIDPGFRPDIAERRGVGTGSEGDVEPVRRVAEAHEVRSGEVRAGRVVLQRQQRAGAAAFGATADRFAVRGIAAPGAAGEGERDVRSGISMQRQHEGEPEAETQEPRVHDTDPQPMEGLQHPMFRPWAGMRWLTVSEHAGERVIVKRVAELEIFVEHGVALVAAELLGHRIRQPRG